MPGKGYVVNGLGEFCARVGITYGNPKGSSWQCVSDGIEPSSLSCGVTGCFAVRSKRVFYRVGTNDTNPVGTAWLPLESGRFMDILEIAAGPRYELWAITTGINSVYRIIGVTDQSPTGHAWEQVPDVHLSKVTIGIFGPVGVLKSMNRVVALNGKCVRPRTFLIFNFLINPGTSEVKGKERGKWGRWGRGGGGGENNCLFDFATSRPLLFRHCCETKNEVTRRAARRVEVPKRSTCFACRDSYLISKF